jgi:hypothetical protein
VLEIALSQPILTGDENITNKSGLALNEFFLDFNLFYLYQILQIYSCAKPNEESIYLYSKIANYYENVVESCISSKQIGFHDILKNLSFPAQNASNSYWKNFVEEVEIILKEQRDLYFDWNLTQEQIDRLPKYFYTIGLLLECMEIKQPPNRDAILRNIINTKPQG